MMINEPYIYESWSKLPGFKRVIQPTEGRNSFTQPEYPCRIQAFFDSERAAGRDTKVAMISCNCPKCRIHCL